MNDDARRKRETAIFRAAYDLLALHGYAGTSMLRVAKAARASNETLYRWYGDKDGLFKAMVRANAAETRRILGEALTRQDDPWATLEDAAPVFLRMILGDDAVLLNRVAAADPSGTLGAGISAGGRSEIMPLLNQTMQCICAGTACDPGDAADWFLGLLVGDLQTRRIIAACPALSEPEIRARCGKALTVLHRLIHSPQP